MPADRSCPLSCQQLRTRADFSLAPPFHGMNHHGRACVLHGQHWSPAPGPQGPSDAALRARVGALAAVCWAGGRCREVAISQVSSLVGGHPFPLHSPTPYMATPKSRENRWEGKQGGPRWATRTHLIAVLIVQIHGVEQDLIEVVLGRGGRGGYRPAPACCSLQSPATSVGPGESAGSQEPRPNNEAEHRSADWALEAGQCRTHLQLQQRYLLLWGKMTCLKSTPHPRLSHIRSHPRAPRCSLLASPHSWGRGPRCLASLPCHQYAQGLGLSLPGPPHSSPVRTPDTQV